jgi:hypothetical protein
MKAIHGNRLLRHTTSHTVSASLFNFDQKWDVMANWSKNPKHKTSHWQSAYIPANGWTDTIKLIDTIG